MEFSPGLAQSAFDLLRLIGRQGLTIPALLEGLRRIGGMPSQVVLEVTQTLNWVTLGDGGRLLAAQRGVRLLEDGCYASMLRRALLDYADILSPPWLQNASYGRMRVMSFAAIGIRQIMVEAGVAEGIQDDVVAFWDELATLARGRRDERLSAIGRHGERLTLAHEAERTGRVPRWVAIDNNADGFDVLSVYAPDNGAQLAIEVKTTSIGLAGSMFLTRAEWETATESSAYLFHLWDISRVSEPRLATISVDDMSCHIPKDLGEGRWGNVEVPFSVFTDRFAVAYAKKLLA